MVRRGATEINSIIEENKTLIAEVERLERALGPFAASANGLDDAHRDDSDIWEAPVGMSITAGDLRRARSRSQGDLP